MALRKQVELTMGRPLTVDRKTAIDAALGVCSSLDRMVRRRASTLAATVVPTCR